MNNDIPKGSEASSREGQDLVRLNQLFERQRAAFRAHGNPGLRQRQEALQRLQDALVRHDDRLAAAVSADFGNRSRHETRIAELFTSIEGIRHARRHLRAWMRPERRSVSFWFKPAKARVEYQPLGVIGIIVPFNYPVYLAIGPLVGALAAGNRALIKMSEYTPRTGEALQEVLAEAFTEEEVAVINGGLEVAQAFSGLPFDHMFFTGSTAVGKQIMKAASANLTPVTLELGGKSPTVMGPDADWNTAVRRIMYGKLLNAGQTCVAPDYLLLPDGQQARFAEDAAKAVADLYPTLRDNPDYTSIINQRQYERLRATLNDAVAKGARLTELNPAKEDLPEAERKLAPTLVLDTTADMRLNQEELFGPVLPILSYQTLDEAIRYINERPRPLALYYFGSGNTTIRRVLEDTTSGSVAINETCLQVALDDLPFGGVGASGMGHYHGREGFETFSKKKSVMYQSKLNGIFLFYPPYGKLTDRLLGFMLGKKKL